MQQAGIAQLENRYITEASGGQLQRVGICRALINHPVVVFADEPTGALDSAATAGVLDLLRSLSDGGTTLVTVTHDPGVAAHASRVLAMSDGCLAGELVLGAVSPHDLDAIAARRDLVSAWVSQSLTVNPTGSAV